MNFYAIENTGFVTKIDNAKDYSEAVETFERQYPDNESFIVVDEATAKLIVKSIETLK